MGIVYESSDEEKKRHEDKSDVTIDHAIRIPNVAMDTLITFEMLDDDGGKDDNLLTKAVFVQRIIDDASNGVRWGGSNPKQHGNYLELRGVNWDDGKKWENPAVTMGEFNLFPFQ